MDQELNFKSGVLRVNDGEACADSTWGFVWRLVYNPKRRAGGAFTSPNRGSGRGRNGFRDFHRLRDRISGKTNGL